MAPVAQNLGVRCCLAFAHPVSEVRSFALSCSPFAAFGYNGSRQPTILEIAMAATSKAAQAAHAQHLLETGQCSTLKDAAKQAGVSLSTLRRHEVTLAKARAAQAAAPDAVSVPSLSVTHQPSNVASWVQHDPATDMGLAPAPAQNADELKTRVTLLYLTQPGDTNKSSVGEQTIRILEATSDLFEAGSINTSTVKSHLDGLSMNAEPIVDAATSHDPDRFKAAVERVDSVTGYDWNKQMEHVGRPQPRPGAPREAAQRRLLSKQRKTLAVMKYGPLRDSANQAAQFVEDFCEMAETDDPDGRNVAAAHVSENLDEFNTLFQAMHEPGGRLRHRSKAATKRFRKVFGSEMFELPGSPSAAAGPAPPS